MRRRFVVELSIFAFTTCSSIFPTLLSFTPRYSTTSTAAMSILPSCINISHSLFISSALFPQKVTNVFFLLIATRDTFALDFTAVNRDAIPRVVFSNRSASSATSPKGRSLSSIRYSLLSSRYFTAFSFTPKPDPSRCSAIMFCMILHCWLAVTHPSFAPISSWTLSSMNNLSPSFSTQLLPKQLLAKKTTSSGLAPLHIISFNKTAAEILGKHFVISIVAITQDLPSLRYSVSNDKVWRRENSKLLPLVNPDWTLTIVLSTQSSKPLLRMILCRILMVQLEILIARNESIETLEPLFL